MSTQPFNSDGGFSTTANITAGNIVGNANVNVVTSGGTWVFDNTGGTIFPTLNVDLHNGGVQSGQVLQFGDGNQQAIITGPAPIVEGYNAQRLIIQGQNGNTGEGGDVYVWGGDSQFNGGDIKIYAGDADNGSSGQGGNIHISGGKGQDTGGEISLTGGITYNGPGAPVVVTGGSGSTTGGNVDLRGGGGGINGGPIALVAGYGGTTGGNVDITGGQSGAGLPGYGNVNINAGASSWHFDNTGTLTTPGASGDITGANVVSAVTFSATGNITGVNLFGNIYPQSGAVLYVDGNRTDTYTANGTINHPYKTVQAALDDATANTTISVAPGVYSENIVMPDLDGICIAGSSEMNTTIANAAPGHTFSWVPAGSVGNTISKFCLTNLEFINTDTTGTYHTLHIDAANVTYPNTFIGEEMDIQTVDFEGAQSQANTTVYLNNVGAQYVWHSQIYGGALTVINPGQFRSTGMTIGNTGDPHDFNVTFDGNLPRNGLGRNDITIAAGTGIFGNVTLNGHPIYQEDVDSVVVGNLNGANLSTFYASGRDYSPTILAYGQHGVVGGTGGSINLTFPDPNTSGTSFNYVDFSNGHILGKVSLTKANLLPLSARGYAVVQGQAQFDTTLANGISANGYVALDLRGANFNQSTLQATGAATIDRSVVTITSQSATTAGNVISISPPLAAGATYTTAVTPNSQSTVWATNKTTSNVKVWASANTTVDITVTRNT